MTDLFYHHKIERLPVAYIVPEEGGGWLVITHRGHGWLFGSRREALEEKRWLDNQWRRR
jgi:hypothetical protein